MKPVIIKFSDRTELYFYESEEQLNSHIEAFFIPKENWSRVNLEEFPGAEHWGDCFQIDGSNVLFDFDMAKGNSKKFLDSLYVKKKSLVLRGLKETDVLLDLYLPEEDRDPTIKKVAEDLTRIGKQLSNCKSLLDKCNDIECVNDALKNIKESWSIHESDSRPL